MATFKATARQQLMIVLPVLLLWYSPHSFHLADGICESETNYYTISQIVLLAGIAASTASKFLVGMALNTAEALVRISSVAAWWKRAALSGMLLLGVVRLSAAYFFLAVAVFEDWYRYLTICAPNVGYPSLIAMELTVSMAYAPFYAWLAVSKNHHWVQ